LRISAILGELIAGLVVGRTGFGVIGYRQPNVSVVGDYLALKLSTT
jgi:Kef-type K+ transport system membrane component KefB